MSFFDIVDILFVSVLIFWFYRLVKNTVVEKIGLGIAIIMIIWFLAKQFEMEMLTYIMDKFFNIGFVFLVIVFQEEIRRFLLFVGSSKFSNSYISNIFFSKKKNNYFSTFTLNILVDACYDMAKEKTGALIVLEKAIPLDIFCASGELIQGVLSKSLLKNIFFKNAPMHDGAVVIQNQKIKAAMVVLPYTNKELISDFGMRHRAGVGITEKTDAIALVISEEKGTISYCVNGQIFKCINKEIFKDWLLTYFSN